MTHHLDEIRIEQLEKDLALAEERIEELKMWRESDREKWRGGDSALIRDALDTIITLVRQV